MSYGMLRRATLALAAGFVTLASASSIRAAAPRDARGVPGVRSGFVVVAPDRSLLAERVAFDTRTAPALAATAPGESVAVEDWPIGVGLRARVTLTRGDVYAPGARIFAAEGGNLVEVPRSPLVFLWGAPDDEPAARVAVSVDPETLAMRAVSLSRAGTHALRPDPASRTRELLVAPVTGRGPAGEPLAWGCGAEELPNPPAPPRAADAPAAAASAVSPAAVSTATLQAVVAVDTDTEFMAKFATDGDATNYLANLFALMTAMYERDLGVKLAQGTTYLRRSSDPWTQTSSGGASGAQLNEFTNYWNANYAGVPRAVAALLSGKQSSAYSASGIGWIDGLCNKNGIGYSFTQVFKFQSDTSAWDAPVVAHEIGHNFGSPHTHCYSPPVDTCFNGESCYTAGTSCPASATYNGVTATGTMMSYCNMLSGCSVSMVFHPRVVSYLQPFISAAGACLTPLAPAPAVASRFYTLPPCRIVDTRNATGPYGGPALQGAGTSRLFTVAGNCGVPADAVSVSANVTVTQTGGVGDLRICAGNLSPSLATAIAFPAGVTRANNARIPLATDGSGKINVVSDGGATHFILDVSGYFK